MTDSTPRTEAGQPCEFVPANEPWTCPVHGGMRTRLDEPQCDRVKPAEPFNDHYLDNLRQSIAEGRYPQGLYNIRRLLATIDARAAQARTEALDADVVAQAFYNVTRRRMTFLPQWDDPSIAQDVWDKARADGQEVAAEYQRILAAKETP